VVFQVALPVSTPSATALVTVATGKKGEIPALIWEHHVLSEHAQTPKLDDTFAAWLDQAHALAEEWFLTLAEGDLLATFKTETAHA